MELERMILNATNEGYGCQNLSVLYPPMDPKYLYPEKNPAINGYHVGLPYTDSNDQYGHGLEDLMLQRQEIIHSKIHMLVSDIYQRHKLRDENLYRICLDQCAFRNLIYQIGDYVWDRNRVELERKIIDLEQEKRREKTMYFSDILFLRKELRESLIEDLEEKQKAALLLDAGEEGIPCSQ